MKSKILAAVAAGALALPTFSAAPASAALTCASAGSYVISTESDLRDLATVTACRDTGRVFTLANSITLTSSWTPIGTSASPFRGIFDGNSYTISGLSIPLTSSSADDFGLFGVTSGATLKNLTLSSVSVSYAPTTSSGPSRVGALVGWAQGTVIQNITVSGAVDGKSTVGGIVGFSGSSSSLTQVRMSGAVGSTAAQTSIGGIAGFAQDTTVSKAYSTASVTAANTGSYVGVGIGGLIGTVYSGVSISESASTGDVSGKEWVGGFIGEVQSGSSVTNSVARGSVTGTAGQIGGFFGKNSGTSSYIYATGAVTGPTNSAWGVVGQNYGNFFTSTYWDTETSGKTSPGRIDPTLTQVTATGLTTDQLRLSSNLSGWNFSSVWGYDCATSTYPTLRWINSSATADACPLPAPEPEPDPAPAPAPAPSPSVEAQPVAPPVTTETVTPVQPQDLVQTTQPPGASVAVIGGQEAVVVNQPLPRGQGIEVSAGPVAMTFRSVTPGGQSVPVAPDGTLVIARSGEVPVSAEGLSPGSTVYKTLYSEPLNLGEGLADANGIYDGSTSIPSTVPTGSHTLVIRGTTKLGEPFILNVGVTVTTPAAALGASPVLTITPAKVRQGSVAHIRARGIQAGCVVTVTAGSSKAIGRASKAGMLQAQLLVGQMKTARWNVTARVGGKGCAPVTVRQAVPILATSSVAK